MFKNNQITGEQTNTAAFEEISNVIKAAPDILFARDPIQHLYPYLLPACIPTDKSSIQEVRKELRKVDYTYRLLREAPHVMNFLINNIIVEEKSKNV